MRRNLKNEAFSIVSLLRVLFSLSFESWFLSPALEFPQSPTTPMEHRGCADGNSGLFFGSGRFLLAFSQLYSSANRFDTPTELLGLGHF